MAKFEINSIDEFIAEIDKLGYLDNNELVDNMGMAGAKAVVEGWKECLNKFIKSESDGGRSTGALIESIEIRADDIGKMDGPYMRVWDIHPWGKDKKGVRNMDKAFYLHYGKTGQPATRFVDEVCDISEDKAVAAMEDVFNNFLEKEGLR